jgi:YaiO family outer membrane protein
VPLIGARIILALSRDRRARKGQFADMTLISAAVLSLTLLAFPQAADQRAEAERLANSGGYEAALKQFQALAAANPDDIDARVWIARLHALMRRPEHAVAVYRSILAVQPQHVDALIGVGNTLVTLGQLDEAADALNRAEALAADRPALLIAQGRLHKAGNHTTLALAYFMRALALDPTNAQARAAADTLRAARAHRVELDYIFQHLNAEVDDAHVGSFELNARVSDAVRIFGRGQVQRAFGVDEQRAGGGLEWSITRRAGLRAGVLIGADTAYLPETDAFVEASVARGRARWSFQLRKADFEGADFWLGGPGLAVAVLPRVEASIQYYRGRLDAEGFGESTTDSVVLGLAGAAGSRVRLGVAFTHGIDRLDWLTLDRLNTEADTLSLTAGYDFTPFVTFRSGYEFQSRPAGLQAHRARAGFVFRF